MFKCRDCNSIMKPVERELFLGMATQLVCSHCDSVWIVPATTVSGRVKVYKA